MKPRYVKLGAAYYSMCSARRTYCKMNRPVRTTGLAPSRSPIMIHELFRVLRSAEVQSRAPRTLPLLYWNLMSPAISQAPPLQRRPLVLPHPLLQLNPLLAHLLHVEETHTAQIREILLHLFQMTWQKVTTVPQTQQWMGE